MIDGFKRNSTIYVGDSIVRKTDLYKIEQGKGRSSLFTGSKNRACDRESREDYGKGKWRVHTGTHRDEQHRKGRNNSNSGEVQEHTEEDEESKGGTDNLIRNLPVFGNNIHGYRNSKRMAVNGMVKRFCKEEEVGYVDLWDSVVGKEEMYARDGLHLSGKGASVFAKGLSGAVASGLGKVSYLN